MSTTRPACLQLHCTYPECNCAINRDSMRRFIADTASDASGVVHTEQSLTDLDRAILRLAHYDLQYHRLRSTVRSLLSTRRQLSSHQTAVLTETVDALERVVAEEPPGIDYRVAVKGVV